MLGVKLLELPLVQLCERQSAPLEPVAEIRYQQTFACYREPSVTLVGETLRKAINMGCDWSNADALGWRG
jgi:hypothetical protein